MGLRRAAQVERNEAGDPKATTEEGNYELKNATGVADP